jgi:hypothetical protein
MAVVEILRAKTCKDSTIMHLLRCMHFLCATHDVRITATHIAGMNNGMADALSRDKLNLFFVSSPKAHRQPTTIPRELWDLVVAVQPDWLSADWRKKLSTFSVRA